MQAGDESPEWRDFRAQLISSEAGAAKPIRSARNEAQLRLQDEQLWKEYRAGVWAHPLTFPEPGCLLCALPLQAQLVHLLRHGHSSYWAGRLHDCLLAELPKSKTNDKALFQRWIHNTAFVYRLATGLANDALGRMKTSWKAPSETERELWQMQQRALSVRAQVCLVLEVSGVKCRSIILNRPMASSIDASLAHHLLFGKVAAAPPAALKTAEEGAPIRQARKAELAASFAATFGGCTVYRGGGCGQLECPATCIHGVSSLPGAHELSPGMGVFSSSAEAALEAVLSGIAEPASFRFFVGHQEELSTQNGEWLAVACSRPLVLKQCRSLPKPLWHEVMELCGGECFEMSKLLHKESQCGNHDGPIYRNMD